MKKTKDFSIKIARYVPPGDYVHCGVCKQEKPPSIGPALFLGQEEICKGCGVEHAPVLAALLEMAVIARFHLTELWIANEEEEAKESEITDNVIPISFRVHQSATFVSV